MKDVVIGIDTSCYVTSVALVNGQGQVLFNGRMPLTVKQGGLGLRQSEAFFLHMRQLPSLIEQAMSLVHQQGLTLRGVGVSRAPLSHEDSYMPVFLAGISTAKVIASTCAVPLMAFSHQQGHLRAGEIGLQLPQDYLAVHLSGGTTQVLRVNRLTWETQALGGSLDISAGQWIDRIGVKCGAPFPAGPWMEEKALMAEGEEPPINVSVHNVCFSLSGAEAHSKRRLEAGAEIGALAKQIFLCLSRALSKAICQAQEETGVNTVLVTGGVAANSLVREDLIHQVNERNRDLKVLFSSPSYAGDNAAGIALLMAEKSGLSC